MRADVPSATLQRTSLVSGLYDQGHETWPLPGRATWSDFASVNEEVEQ